MKDNLTRDVMLTILRRKRWQTAALALVVIAVALLSLIPPQILKNFIDRELTPLRSGALLRYGLLYFAALLLIGLFDFLKGVLLTVLGQEIIRQLREKLFHKLGHMSATFFSANSPAAITSRITNDVENVNSLFTEGIVSMLIDSLKIIGIVVSIWIFSFRLGILVLCLVPFIFTLTRFFKNRVLKAQVRNLEQLGVVNTHIAETMKNVRMIKSFSKETYMEDVYKQKLRGNFDTINSVNLLDSFYSPIIQLVKTILIALVVIFSSDQLQFLKISLGMAAASIDLISDLFSPIETLGMELQNIQKGLSGVKRVNDFYRAPEEPRKNRALSASEILGADHQAALSFEHVSFAYQDEFPIIRDLSLKVEAQSSVTFAGRTGVGKTTLFKLIMGLLEPQQGEIDINGVNVYQIPNREKRKIYGYVEQRFSFIQGSIAEQISLGDENITQEQIENAMKFVGLHETVLQMEEGYQSPAHEEGSFSQGQKQLLAIARAIAADPPLLLLDEVTANLDSVTESQIISVLQKAGEGRTILSISHRLTSMLNCDKMVLLEDGRIRAAGSPTDVLEKDEWFRNAVGLEQNEWNHSATKR